MEETLWSVIYEQGFIFDSVYFFENKLDCERIIIYEHVLNFFFLSDTKVVFIYQLIKSLEFWIIVTITDGKHLIL